MTPARVDIPENHRRRISITLTILDETLCRFQQWADGWESHGALYHETNTLAHKQRRAVRARVAELRRLLEGFRDALGLSGRSVDARGDIWSQSAGLRECLIELESKRLRGYGDLAPAVARYVDQMAEVLMHHVDGIAAVVSRSRRAGP